jgi:hypothetical protein
VNNSDRASVDFGAQAGKPITRFLVVVGTLATAVRRRRPLVGPPTFTRRGDRSPEMGPFQWRLGSFGWASGDWTEIKGGAHTWRRIVWRLWFGRLRAAAPMKSALPPRAEAPGGRTGPGRSERGA